MRPDPHVATSAEPAYRIEPLADRHDRSAFESGVAPLDRYLAAQAGQDIRRRVATCFVAVEGDDPTVRGYYTLAATGIVLTELPQGIAKKLPRYPVVPATLLGRLATDHRWRGRGLGEFLLMDAFSRVLHSDIATFAFVVDAKDQAAQHFYKHYGFEVLSRNQGRLFLPVAKIAKAFL